MHFSFHIFYRKNFNNFIAIFYNTIVSLLCSTFTLLRFQNNFFVFSRNGWERKPDYRGKECQEMNEHDLQMTLEECVRAKRPECKTPDIEYIEFICGNQEICKANQQNYQKKRLALEMAKIRLLKEYYIGKNFKTILYCF